MGRQDQEGLRLRFQVQPRHLRRLLAVCLDWFHKLAYKLQGRQPCSRGMQQLGGQASERPRCACCAAAGDHSVHSAPRRYRPRRRWRSAQLPAEKQETEREGKSVLGGERRGEGVEERHVQACTRSASVCCTAAVLRERERESCAAAVLHLHCSRAVQQGCPSTPRQPPRTCTLRRPRCSRASSLPIRASRYGAMVSWSEASVGAGERAAGARQVQKCGRRWARASTGGGRGQSWLGASAPHRGRGAGQGAATVVRPTPSDGGCPWLPQTNTS